MDLGGMEVRFLAPLGGDANDLYSQLQDFNNVD